MSSPTTPESIRHSVALPPQLVPEALRSAPANIDGNFNQLVILSLQQFIASQKAATFEAAMADMAADPTIRAESLAISKEFEPA